MAQLVRRITNIASVGRQWVSLGSQILKYDSYVDDIVSGAPDFPITLIIQNELINLLLAGGFTYIHVNGLQIMRCCLNICLQKYCSRMQLIIKPQWNENPRIDVAVVHRYV